MDFGATISRAFRITWDNKVLWILGFLVALGGGNGANGSQGFQYTSSSRQLPASIQEFFNNPQMMGVIYSGALALFCLVFIVAIALIVIGIIARGGLIAGVQQIEGEGSTTFGRAWAVGAARFWRLLGLDILLWLPLVVIAVIIAVIFGASIVGVVAAGMGQRGDSSGAVIASLFATGFAVFCCLLCVVVVYSLLASALQVFGERAIVIENRDVFDSIRRAWAIFRANLGNIVLLALVMLVIGIVFGLITGAVVAVTALPTIILAVTDASRGVLGIGTVIVALVSVVIAIALAAIVNALFITFNSAAWTLAFRQFTGTAPVVAPLSAAPPAPAA